MQNVTMKVCGSKLTLEVDLSQDFGLSSSGKTNIVASTQGNVRVSEADLLEDPVGINLGKIFIGLNVYKK